MLVKLFNWRNENYNVLYLGGSLLWHNQNPCQPSLYTSAHVTTWHVYSLYVHFPLLSPVTLRSKTVSFYLSSN